MIGYKNFSELLKDNIKNNARSITFITGKDREESISYNELYQNALKILGYFQSIGISYKDELVLQTKHNKDFLHIFIAAVLGGIRIVPIADGYSEEHRLKLFKIWGKLNNPTLICEANYIEKLKKVSKENNIDMGTIEDNFVDIKNIYLYEMNGKEVDVCQEDIVHIQFSSGSTGDPKGVIVTQSSLLANLEAMAEALKLDKTDSTACWMPLTHDMGLICHMLPIALNIDQYSIPTDLFVRNPVVLLETISKYRITFTQSPNFGLKYIMLFDNRGKIKECDISSLRIILNGAEPINYNLCQEFSVQMKKYKLKENVICPGYGLAEATLAVSIDTVDEAIKRVIVDRRYLNIGQKIVYLQQESEYSTIFVEEGYPVRYCEISIRDENGDELPENTVGIIYLKGINVTRGFYNDVEKTKETITEDGWLNTGDTGFIREDKVIIVGRIKDIVFVNGQNFYSHDIENVAQEIEGVEVGKIAITAAHNYDKQTEDIVAFIVSKSNVKNIIPLIQEVKAHLNRRLGIEINEFVTIKQMPKTTSGKVQRFMLGQQYSNGQFNTTIAEIRKLLNESQQVEEKKANFEGEELEEEIADIFREISGKKIEVEDNLFEVGVSSLVLTQAIEEINSKFNCNIQVTDAFIYPSIRKMCQFIKGDVKESKEELIKEVSYDEDIAIVGIGINLPGADDIDEYWENLIRCEDQVKEYNGQRKIDTVKMLRYLDNDTKNIEFIKAAYLDEIDCFDNKYFKITPNEAMAMPPTQRLFLQSCTKAIEDAGYNTKKIKGESIGVYVGYIGDSEGYKYQDILDSAGKTNTPTGRLAANIAGRVSFAFDLKGPSILVDCACSSSMMALHIACQGLRNGDCTAAIVGGVRLMLIPIKDDNQIGIESNDGKTRPFDAQSNGTGDGEGIVSIVIKPLAEAVKNNDHIYAVIKGTVSNQDGNSISISAPNLQAQEDLIVKGYKNSKINPRTIGYLEAHGTGTILGDPIEVQALNNAFQRFTLEKEFCSIGSVKANIGHLYAASGLASIVKCCLMLEHRKMVPLMNYTNPNPKINFKESPFWINTKVIEWKKQEYPRRCGISNFGFSGTNVHIILEEFKKQRQERKSYSYHVFAISANTIKSLEEMIKSMSKYIEIHSELSIEDICYTLGRRAGYSFRIAIMARNKEELIAQLNDKIQHGINEDNIGIQHVVYRGRGKEKSKNEMYEEDIVEINRVSDMLIEMIDEDQGDRERILRRLCELYRTGADVQWSKQYKEPYNIIHLPSYAFEKKRFWPSL